MKRNKFMLLAMMAFSGSVLMSSRKRLSFFRNTICNDPITPPVPEGPYYKNEGLNRVDITEGKKGTPVEYVFRVVDKDCNPIKNAMVDIWQCDAEGHYSDFKAENTINETWLRGFQKVDDQGECRFKSIFPGWYPNRITHLHAKVHVNGQTLLTTNFFFPKDIENEVFKSPLYPKGPNPLTVLQDYELKVDKDTSRHDTLVMNVTKDKNGKLIASYKIAIS